MHRILVYVTFGFLALSGLGHFAVDVVSQYVRRTRLPGPETTLYFGLNTAYALGQFAFGVLGLLVAREAPKLLSRWPALALSFGAALAWLAVSFSFIEYREPRIAMAIFTMLVVAVAATA